MYIYRMENEKGEGCYHAKEFTPSPEVDEFLNWHCWGNGRPCPSEDVGINRDIVYGVEIYGFLNIRQAIKWFNSYERKALRKEGFKIGKRKVKQITAIGKSQCLAIP